MQDGKKSFILLFFSLEDSPKLSICINFIELYSLKFKSWSPAKALWKIFQLTNKQVAQPKTLFFLKSEF